MRPLPEPTASGAPGGAGVRPDREDRAVLHLDLARPALHVGSVMVFDRVGDPLTYERLMEIVAARLPYAPRYRQKLRPVPGGLGAPVWVTDAELDLPFHVRRAALPSPGSDVQLEEFVARVVARPLDSDRPLWEVYLVEGLEHDRFALVTKVHEAVVDGVHAVDLAELLLGEGPVPRVPGPTWEPGREPSAVELLTGALLGAVRSPARLAVAARGALVQMGHVAGEATRTLGEAAGALARVVSGPAPAGPLVTTTGQARRFVMVGVDLDEVRQARRRHTSGDDISLNDVVLAVVTGALRTWMQSRGEPVGRSATVRALVPVRVDDPDDGPQMRPCLVDLPVGEPNPAMRLVQVAYAMRRELAGRGAVPATALADLAGFAAPTLHALGARLSAAMTRRLFGLVVTNVPGPQRVLDVDGHPMVSTFPVVPLLDGHALAVGVSSYAGGLFVGLVADRAAVPDLDVLGAAVVESLAELREGD